MSGGRGELGLPRVRDPSSSGSCEVDDAVSGGEMRNLSLRIAIALPVALSGPQLWRCTGLWVTLSSSTLVQAGWARGQSMDRGVGSYTLGTRLGRSGDFV